MTLQRCVLEADSTETWMMRAGGDMPQTTWAPAAKRGKTRWIGWRGSRRANEWLSLEGDWVLRAACCVLHAAC
jgi:hypothetical protein